MFGRTTLFLVFVGSLIASSSAFAQRGGRLALPTNRMLRPYGLERAWWSQATIDRDRDRIRHIVADEDVVFVQSRSGFVTAFNAQNGQKLWARLLGRRDNPTFPLTTNDDIAVVISGLEMFALEKFTGKLMWKIRIPTAPSTSASMDEELVYVGMRDGSVYAYELNSIRQRFQEQKLPKWTNTTLRWRFKGYKEVTTPPLSTGRVVNFASAGGSLYSVTTARRKLSFQFETDASVSAPMTHSRGRYDEKAKRYKRYLFMSSEDFKLYCLDMDNGRVRWEYGAGMPIRSSAQVVENNVYVSPLRGGLHCLDEVEGRLKWKRPEGAQFLAANAKMVMASDRMGNILLLSRDTGGLYGVLPLRGFNVRLSNGRTDRMFIATDTGLVVCVREIGREFPIYYQYPDRRPIEVEFAPEPPKAKAKPAMP